MENLERLSITREFDAPVELVWKAWTSPEALAKWWGPKGMEMNVADLEVKPGGKFHYSMKAPNGYEMWGLFVFKEVTAPHKLVFINSFSDKDAGLTSNPYIKNWPLEVYNVLTLTEHDGKTTLTLAGGPINAKDEEVKVYDENKGNINEAFKDTFGALDNFLKN